MSEVIPAPSTALSPSLPAPPGGRRALGEAGFSLIEAVIVLMVLAIGILGHVTTIAVAHRHSRDTEEHGLAVATLERFIERIRADTDWSGTGPWGRFRPLSRESGGDNTLTRLGADPALLVYDATAWYTGFIVPKPLQDDTPSAQSYCQFLVQVPVTDPSGTPTLREDMNAPRYGLPWDLNGDGVIDAADHSRDYRQLPIVVRMRWQKAGQAATEIVVPTWLRGSR